GVHRHGHGHGHLHSNPLQHTSSHAPETTAFNPHGNPVLEPSTRRGDDKRADWGSKEPYKTNNLLTTRVGSAADMGALGPCYTAPAPAHNSHLSGPPPGQGGLERPMPKGAGAGAGARAGAG
ncbi:unnamed protein product, partial [Discosporangium mesarthrocarpum]